MKSVTAVASAALVLLCGCSSSGVAIEGAPLPSPALAASSGKSLDRLQRGYSVYLLKCGECHVRKLPAEVSGPDWHGVVPGMAWNAGLTEADEAAVLAYLTAASERSE